MCVRSRQLHMAGRSRMRMRIVMQVEAMIAALAKTVALPVFAGSSGAGMRRRGASFEGRSNVQVHGMYEGAARRSRTKTAAFVKCRAYVGMNVGAGHFEGAITALEVLADRCAHRVRAVRIRTLEVHAIARQKMMTNRQLSKLLLVA